MRNLVILPSDKGREFCIISKTDYQTLALNHFQDNNVQKKINHIQPKTIETRINNEWHQVCDNYHLPHYIKKSYTTSNSSLPSFYHLIKTHKEGPSLKIRPIVSAIDSPSWRLCHFVNKLLKLSLDNVPAHLENSQTLIDNIKSLDRSTISRYNYVCSLDVCSLYTSIPIDDS